MGSPKQLLPVDGSPAVVRCVQTIQASGVQDIVVVINPQGERVAEVLTDQPVKITVNSIPESDMAESIRVGLGALDAAATGVFVFPCDCPLVGSPTLVAMIKKHDLNPGEIIIPLFQRRRGHPSLFPVPLLEGLREYPTLRHIVSRYEGNAVYVPVEDEGVILDMDTPEDYLKILSLIPASLSERNL
ncbi:MAG: nucleotidyltransferase family protein [Smithellaceae bacterium]|nr:nucleotidyltransferase family protein [Smithellaceae bacterium]